MLAKNKLCKVLGIVKTANGTNARLTSGTLVATRRSRVCQTGQAQCTVLALRVNRTSTLDTGGTTSTRLTLLTLVASRSIWIVETVETRFANRTFLF